MKEDLSFMEIIEGLLSYTIALFFTPLYQKPLTIMFKNKKRNCYVAKTLLEQLSGLTDNSLNNGECLLFLTNNNNEKRFNMKYVSNVNLYAFDYCYVKNNVIYLENEVKVNKKDDYLWTTKGKYCLEVVESASASMSRSKLRKSKQKYNL